VEDFIKLINESITLKDEQLVITPEMEISKDIGMTSLDIMVVVLAIERKYEKHLTIESLMKVKTVADLYSLVA
jgi:acyl carrier protein